MNIEINNLSFAYKDKLALDDINLTMESGDLVTILGPNGSGKSTLLKCIVSILKTNDGAIPIDGSSPKSYITSELSQPLVHILSCET